MSARIVNPFYAARRRTRPPAHRPLQVLDLFSGIGGFSLGLERAGIEPVGEFAVSEIVACDCEKCQNHRAALALHLSGTSGQFLSLPDATCRDDRFAELSLIALAWPQLPEHVRASILLLVQAATCQ